MSEAFDNPVGRTMLESAEAMVDAIFDNQDVAGRIVVHVAKDESVTAQRLATYCMAILIAIGQGKIPHVKWEPPQ